MTDADKNSDSLAYCAELLKTGDEDRWLTAQFAPEAARGRLLALFALAHEIERAPQAVSEAPLGEIRLQWWREAIGELAQGAAARGHPVLQAALRTSLIEPSAVPLFDALIDARARQLYGDPFTSLEDLSGWLQRTEGGLAVLAAGLSGSGEEREREALRRAGTAYGLARDGARLAPALADRIKTCTDELRGAARAGLSALSVEAASAVRYLALTRAYGGGSISPAGKRWRLFWATLRGRL